MVDLETLNTAYRIEKRSPLLSTLENKELYSSVYRDIIDPIEEELRIFKEAGEEGGEEIDTDCLTKCRRTLSELKHLRAGKIATETLSLVRFNRGFNGYSTYDSSRLSCDPKGDEVALHNDLKEAFRKYIYGDSD